MSFALLILFIVLFGVLWAAPTPTTRQTPAGIALDDGFSTKITFAADPDVSFWERSVKPPGVDGGDGIDQTTMHQTAWRVMRARQLKSLTPASGKAAYDPNLYNNIIALINVETTITVRFPDGSTLAFYGYLQSVDFDELVEGQLPECSYQITPTNFDPTNHVEAAPVLTSIPGT